MNKKSIKETERRELKADLLAGRGAQKTGLEEKKKGKTFVDDLDKCTTLNEIIDFLCSSMPLATLKDRVGHISDNELVLVLQAAGLRVNVNRGYEPRHVEKVILAAARYADFPKKKTIKIFKEEIIKKISILEQEKNDNSTEIKIQASLV